MAEIEISLSFLLIVGQVVALNRVCRAKCEQLFVYA
jgi:hypothetical protein